MTTSYQNYLWSVTSFAHPASVTSSNHHYFRSPCCGRRGPPCCKSLRHLKVRIQLSGHFPVHVVIFARVSKRQDETNSGLGRGECAYPLTIRQPGGRFDSCITCCHWEWLVKWTAKYLGEHTRLKRATRSTFSTLFSDFTINSSIAGSETSCRLRFIAGRRFGASTKVIDIRSSKHAKNRPEVKKGSWDISQICSSWPDGF